MNKCSSEWTKKVPSVTAQFARPTTNNCHNYKVGKFHVRELIPLDEHKSVFQYPNHDIADVPKLKTRKVRIYPDNIQRRQLNKMMAATRVIYNHLLGFCKEQWRLNYARTNEIELLQAKMNDTSSKKRFRVLQSKLRYLEKIKPLKTNLKTLNGEVKNMKTVDNLKWVHDKSIGSATRGAVVLDALKNFNSAYAGWNARRKKGVFSSKPQFKFKSRRNTCGNFTVIKSNWGRRGMYQFLTKIKSQEPIPKVNHDFRVKKDLFGRYFFCFPVENEVDVTYKESVRSRLPRVVSIDPGERSFGTCYTPEGKVFEWGVGDINRLKATHYKTYRLTSQLTRTPSRDGLKRPRQRLRKKIKHLKELIRNQVRDFHHKYARWLCENFDVILYPDYGTQNMVKKERYGKKRKIGRSTVNGMMIWSSFKFKEILKFKSARFPNVQVINCTEFYTTVTCGVCGYINKSFSGKTFKCNECKYTADRDFNAARNILMKYVIEELLDGRQFRRAIGSGLSSK